jgi:hypothetical protein
MDESARNRGASGHGSIMFRQDLTYPRVPNQITYYPPEPSEELKKQVLKDKAGGIALYIIGFALGLIGLIAALNYSSDIEVYAWLIPLLLIFGLIFAVLFLVLDNVVLAKLSRSLPVILLIALILLYAMSIMTDIFDVISYAETAPDAQSVTDYMVNNLIPALVNPTFFLLSAALLICRAGGTMLWTSTKVVHQYIPGTIIIEVPGYTQPGESHGDRDEEESEEEEDSDVEEERFCENCDGQLTYIAQYDRWYCYECREYAPKD